MGNPAKFDRCVKKVKARARGPVNAYAVCTAAGTRNPSQQRYNSDPFDGFDEKSFEESQEGRFGNLRGFSKRIGRGFPVTVLQKVRTRSLVRVDYFGEPRYGWLNNEEIVTEQKFLKRFGYPPEGRIGSKTNPEPAAADMYSSFHGAPSEEVIEYQDSEHYHGNLAGLGILVELKLVTVSGYDVTLTFSTPDALVDDNPGLWDKLKGLSRRSSPWVLYESKPDEVSAQRVAGMLDSKGITSQKIQKRKSGGSLLKPKYVYDVLVNREQVRNLFKEQELQKNLTDVIKRRRAHRREAVRKAFGSGKDKFGAKDGRKGGSKVKLLKYKGVTVERDGKEFRVPSLDSSVFDTYSDAKRFIDATKKNPGKGTGPFQSASRLIGQAGGYLDDQLGRALNPERYTVVGSPRMMKGSYGVLDNQTGNLVRSVGTKAVAVEIAKKLNEEGPEGISGQRKQNPSLDPALLCSNESGTQLYVQGGDQSVDLASIHMDEPDYSRDSIVLGEAYFISYFTSKDFDKFQPTIYEHDLGEESDPPSPKYRKDEPHTARNRRLTGTGSGYYPIVRYDAMNQKLYLDGGQYKIDKPLFSTSPGLEN